MQEREKMRWIYIYNVLDCSWLSFIILFLIVIILLVCLTMKQQQVISQNRNTRRSVDTIAIYSSYLFARHFERGENKVIVRYFAKLNQKINVDPSLNFRDDRNDAIPSLKHPSRKETLHLPLKREIFIVTSHLPRYIKFTTRPILSLSLSLSFTLNHPDTD